MPIQVRDLERHRLAQSQLSSLVKAELERFFRRLNLSNPDNVKLALLQYIPILIEKYGAVSEQLALEFYEQLLLTSSAAGLYTPSVPPLPDDFPDAITGMIKYSIGPLWTPNPEKALDRLLVKTDKFVKEPGRQTMIFNAEQEGVWWARVPTGTETCSFCLVLASRGADYHSKRSAGSREYGEENLFHGECDCDIVRLGIDDEYPPGYLPEDIYNVYDESARRVGRNNLSAVLYDFRRRNSEMVSDGVDDDEYLSKIG